MYTSSLHDLNRRRFLLLSAAAAATSQLPAQAQTVPGATAQKAFEVMLGLHLDKPGPTLPANFVGLSYETQQLTDPSFFSAANTGLIAQFRALAPNGVLRLGGNTSDIGWWKATPDSPRPEIHVHASGPGEPTADLAYSITPQAILNLRDFLHATGWTCLYGINLGTNTPARAAEEAAFVSSTLGWVASGGKLEYFQLGNEPDLFKTHLRDPKTWSANLYFDEWMDAATAITERVRQARFGLPDTSGNPEWFKVIVDRYIQKFPPAPPCNMPQPAACMDGSQHATQPRIAALSHHYYFGGPPSNPEVNITRLLHPAARVTETAATIQSAAARLGAAEHRTVPYRMSEGNTCYRGGKPGVSDTFASALWVADYMLTLAGFGYAGVNIHGGDGNAVAKSLGGTLPGELLMPDPTVPHPRPFYTPINHAGDQYMPEPIYFGMFFAGHFAGATMIPVDFDPGPVNATAYAARNADGRTLIAVINKDPAAPLLIHPGVKPHKILRLTAPSLTSTSASLTPAVMPQTKPKKPGKDDSFTGPNGVFSVPAASAILFEA